MEVFLRNVPQDLSEDGLRKELLPFMNALGIQDWSCDKFRTRNHAWVIFLNEADGRKFLLKHEKQKAEPGKFQHPLPPGTSNFRPRGRDLARLFILRSPVYVEKSTRKVDKHILAHLKHKREEKKKSIRDPKAPALTFQSHSISCGDIFFDQDDDNNLTFAPQAEWFGAATGKFGQARFTLMLENQLSSTTSPCRIDISYDTIYDLIPGQSTKDLTFILSEPPRMYSAVSGDQFVKWERVQSFPHWSSHSEHVATALVYQMNVIGYDFDKLIRVLKSRDIFSVTRHPLGFLHKSLCTPEVDQATGNSLLEWCLKGALKDGVLPFGLLFQIQALVWNNYLRPFVGSQLLTALESMAKDSLKNRTPLPITTESMKYLFQSIPYPCPGTDPIELNPHELLGRVQTAEIAARNNDPRRDQIYGAKAPAQQAWIFKAMVTPTRIVLSGPDAESRNRVLRMFPDHTDYFLRVTFSDEDGQDLALQPKISNNLVFRRYREILRDGIQIAGRQFSFLGFSHSSLRSHSAWFSAPFIDSDLRIQSYETILSSLGDFSEIRIPAKCAARIGQAFSETPFAVSLSEHGIKHCAIPDVKNADGSRIFSDGVGTISFGALEDIWSSLPLRSSLPTCLQIRWGGYKGMLSLDSRLRGKMVCVRPETMMKFPSKDLHEMGICDTSSKPLRLVLNRQMIKILEDMGTKEHWFMNLQAKALSILQGVTAKAINTSTFLQYQAIGINMGLPQLIKQLDRMGIDYRRDKFLRSAVEHVVLRELRLLKHKARIPVEKGVTLFGIMDETGFLQEGQVFVTYDQTYGSNGRRTAASLGDGPVLVTRSPALHPGDIQFVHMVTPPPGHPLLDLQNCIVFSQRGNRDLPSQLSGGDLDGDLYNIIWDDEAWPKCTYSAADYPRVSPKPLDRPVTRDDMADFFIDFMKTDVLGMIANRHVIIADKEEEGTLHQDCIALAGLHSTAVDFSKTGIPVDVKALPKAPRVRPDFLAPAPPLKLYDRGQIDHIGDLEENEDDDDDLGYAKHRYYASEKILGQLYRNIDEKKIWEENIHLKINMEGPSVWDQMLGLIEAQLQEYGLDIDYTRQQLEARNLRDLYETTINDKMWHFSENPRRSLSEVEVFCGFILNKRGSQTHRQRDSSIKLKEDIDRFMALIVKLIRDRGTENDYDVATSVMGSVAENSRWREDTIELCWACVVVGCEKRSKASSYHGTEALQSFPVVAACCLLKELNNLARTMELASGGGDVGVGRGKGRKMTLSGR